MAHKPMRPCLHPGCGRLTRNQYCPQHIPPRVWDRSEDSQRWHRLYDTNEWKQLRAEQLAREPWCTECEKRGRMRVRARAVDHIVPHRGDPELFFDKNNLQSLCDSCHSAKTLQEIWERKRQ